jgi:hypothetical protein
MLPPPQTKVVLEANNRNVKRGSRVFETGHVSRPAPAAGRVAAMQQAGLPACPTFPSPPPHSPNPTPPSTHTHPHTHPTAQYLILGWGISQRDIEMMAKVVQQVRPGGGGWDG